MVSISVTEIVQVKGDRDRRHAGPPHQSHTGGVATVGQQHLGPKRLQNLVDEVGKARRFLHAGHALHGWRPWGMRVIRTPLEAKSITSIDLASPSSARSLYEGNSSLANASSSVVSRSHSNIPAVSDRSSAPGAGSGKLPVASQIEREEARRRVVTQLLRS
jgi:hypothetical protein